MATTKVDINLISATGTASSSTFLRGDSSWNTPDAGGFTQGTEQATTSGTSFTFSGIPAGVQMVCIMFFGVSISGNDNLLIQLGDSGGIETSGYISRSHAEDDGFFSTAQSSTSGLSINNHTGATLTWHGRMILTLEDSSNNCWISSHQFMQLIGSGTHDWGSGSKELSGALTQLKLLCTGSNTFDAGAMNIMYI